MNRILVFLFLLGLLYALYRYQEQIMDTNSTKDQKKDLIKKSEITEVHQIRKCKIMS